MDLPGAHVFALDLVAKGRPCLCMHVCMYVYTQICMYTCVCLKMLICVNVSVYTYVCDVCVCVCVCMCVCVWCVYVCVCACMCVTSLASEVCVWIIAITQMIAYMSSYFPNWLTTPPLFHVHQCCHLWPVPSIDTPFRRLFKIVLAPPLLVWNVWPVSLFIPISNWQCCEGFVCNFMFLIDLPILLYAVVYSGCPNQEIRWSFLFKGLIIRTFSYFGLDSAT
jgi:hypothetical protein